jgi:hypothetical protein
MHICPNLHDDPMKEDTLTTRVQMGTYSLENRNSTSFPTQIWDGSAAISAKLHSKQDHLLQNEVRQLSPAGSDEGLFWFALS